MVLFLETTVTNSKRGEKVTRWISKGFIPFQRKKTDQW